VTAWPARPSRQASSRPSTPAPAMPMWATAQAFLVVSVSSGT
jgi:hypothetical protein